MSKVFDDNSGRWKRMIINPEETVERSTDMVTYASNKLKEFNDDGRVITSMAITVNFCETEESISNSKSGFKYNQIMDVLEKSMLIIEDPDDVYSIDPADSSILDRSDDEPITIRRQLTRYLDAIVSRGMLNQWQYIRFNDTVILVYRLLVGFIDVSINLQQVLNRLNMNYSIKYYPPTTACPDAFWKVVKEDTVTNTDVIANTTNAEFSPDVVKKIDQLMKLWFNNGTGKVYDKDRDEFYAEFTAILGTSNNDADSEDGMVVVTRRSRSKQVMATKPMINYSYINEVLQRCGLNYHITYRQENTGTKRRNALALMKGDNR